MPKYNVPAEKPYDMPETSSKPKSRQPKVYIPFKPEWMKKVTVGEKIEITLKGEVVGLHLDESKNRSRSEVEVEVKSVEHYGSDSNAKVLMDDSTEED